MNIPNVSPLACEYRGELLDLTLFGHFCVTDETGKIICSGGDPDAVVSYRSAAKPIQALPVLMHGLDREYGLSQEEIAIFSGSHRAEKIHVKVLESIMEKTGLREEQLIVNPCPPTDETDYDGVPRKIYHVCSGKHLALMLLQRFLTGSVCGYHLEDSAAQKEVKSVIATLSGCSEQEMGVATDGCGVPVYAVKLRNMADAFVRMACPDLAEDKALREAIVKMRCSMNTYPLMVRGTNTSSSIVNSDSDIVAKCGANGLFCLGLTKKRLGIAVKLTSGGMPDWTTFAVRKILEGLNYDNSSVLDRLAQLKPDAVTNACGEVVGRREFLYFNE